MGKIFDSVATLARRTTNPYRVQTRVVLMLDAVIVLMFAGLVLMRMQLTQDQGITDTKSASILKSAAGAGGSWSTDFFVAVIDNLAAGLVVALVASILLLLISPKEQMQEDIVALPSWNIREMLLAPLANTKSYRFRGRSGRFMRKSVMPELYNAGRRDSQRRELLMLLPNPAETATLKAYAHYRNSLASETSIWTADRISIEIIATIIQAAHLSNRNRFFDAKIFLKSDFALFRLDMSDEHLVMTREDPKWPGIICSAQSKFYVSYEEEFRMEAESGIELPLPKADLPLGFGRGAINPALRALGIRVQLNLKQCSAVMDAINSPKLPYA